MGAFGLVIAGGVQVLTRAASRVHIGSRVWQKQKRSGRIVGYEGSWVGFWGVGARLSPSLY